jgi:hypothetical protein
MPNFLWGFANNDTGLGATPQQTSVNLPKIVPAGSSGVGTTTQINVVKDFYWTYSKLNEGRQEVPRIILTERKLRTNALVSQLKYSLGQTTGGLSQSLQNIKQFANNTALPGLADFVSKWGGSVPSGLQQIPEDAGNNIPGYLQNASDKIGNWFSSNYRDDNNPTVNGSKWLEPYRNLYLTDPTNWVYVLPYFDNNQAIQANSFSDSGKVGGLGDAVAPFIGMVTEAAEVTASLNNPTQISYIEKTKFYNYPTEGEDINIEFPLINTGEVTFDDVIRNWQFLFLLVYQNRPGKTSQNTVDQPVIYQAEIPGIKFFPFCYVTSITIDFMGARREMTINVPTTNTTTSFLGNVAGQFLGTSTNTTAIQAIIPDAYRVRISLKSMTANTKNFMQHMISNHNVVESGRVPVAREFNLPSAAAAGSPFYAATHPLETVL